MELLERNYKQSRDVTYYADLLHITPKYLSTIVRQVISHTPKEAIDKYVVLRLKLLLRSSQDHQGNIMGIQFQRRLFLLPVFQSAYWHHAAIVSQRL